MMMMSIPQRTGDFFMSSTPNGAIRRIRTPHPHDVLAGRGGGINSHEGNKVFRDYVKVYKNDYTLASSKAEKARVARRVLELVQAQNPPGRFLQRDSGTGTGSYWVEIDDGKAMAKTSQALREGAPTIRAQHKDTPVRFVSEANRLKRKREANPLHGTSPSSFQMSNTLRSGEEVPTKVGAVYPLISNETFHRHSKMIKIIPHNEGATHEDRTPTLMPTSPINTPEELLLDGSSLQSKTLDNDLTTSTSDKESLLPDFVNPFENEDELSVLLMAPALTRGRSNGSKRSVSDIRNPIPTDTFLYLMDMKF